MIEHRVRFASCHESETREIGEHGPRTILAKDMQQSALFRELVRRKVATNGHKGLAQFRSVASVASIPKRAEPTFKCGRSF